MPPLGGYRRMRRRYRARTSVGLDWFRPRRRAWLSDGSLVSMFKLWIVILRFGRFPLISGRFVVDLLPKPDGVERAVALFTTSLRAFARHVRRIYGVAWAGRRAR
eukprot:9011053-Pyramimonas_sp.AAC.1